ncbi:MAG: lipopolysaccharide biosynthesis protein [Actinomycetia bacterium]|nr:lipopolysaccharide biosynthesis protein [Actinomycetes bacterium]
MKKIINIFKKFKFSPGRGLSSKAIRGGFWVFSLRITDRVFKLLRTIVLARLLSPKDFGLFGIALLVLSILETFTESGFQYALIQKKGETRSFLDTAWTIGLIRGFAIAVIVFFVAKPASIFFGAPDAEPILQVIAASIILHNLKNIAVLYFQKELEFKNYFKYQFVGTIVDVTVALTLALLLKTVWALVFGLLAGNMARCIMSYIIEPYRPRIKVNIRQAKELFNFGKWVLGSSIVVFLAIQGDDIFLGKVLGATALGFYQMAFRFANLPGSEIGVLSRVAFPAYSKLQDNIPKLKNAYLRTVRFIIFLSMPLAGGIFILAPQFTQIFLGEKWMPMVPALKILAISAMVRVMIGTGGALFNSRGRPDLDFKMNLCRVITLAITIYPLTMLWKIAGTSLSVLLAVCACIPVWFAGSKKQAGLSFKDFQGILLPPLSGTVVMASVIFILGMFFNQYSLVGFLFSIVIGIVAFIGIIFLYRKILHYNVFEDMKLIFNSLGIKRKRSFEGKNS